ncbi:MAG: hypothetical protein K9M44_02095 [Candidatus Pacebacteria bacterium]|nr:hypothetical protein [Candidatus Paceibacterota bacterium]
MKKEIKTNNLKSGNQEEQNAQPFPVFTYLYLAVIIIGWINIVMLVVSIFALGGAMFGSIPIENMGTSPAEKLVFFGFEYKLWLWFLVPSIIAFWQAIKWEKQGLF